jgi:hypothetical protein
MLLARTIENGDRRSGVIPANVADAATRGLFQG